LGEETPKVGGNGKGIFFKGDLHQWGLFDTCSFGPRRALDFFWGNTPYSKVGVGRGYLGCGLQNNNKGGVGPFRRSYLSVFTGDLIRKSGGHL